MIASVAASFPPPVTIRPEAAPTPPPEPHNSVPGEGSKEPHRDDRVDVTF